jgi:hypothetical protein
MVIALIRLEWPHSLKSCLCGLTRPSILIVPAHPRHREFETILRGLRRGFGTQPPERRSARAALNGLFDEWWKIKDGDPVESIARYGTVDLGAASKKGT